MRSFKEKLEEELNPLDLFEIKVSLGSSRSQILERLKEWETGRKLCCMNYIVTDSFIIYIHHDGWHQTLYDNQGIQWKDICTEGHIVIHENGNLGGMIKSSRPPEIVTCQIDPNSGWTYKFFNEDASYTITEMIAHDYVHIVEQCVTNYILELVQGHVSGLSSWTFFDKKRHQQGQVQCQTKSKKKTGRSLR